jgi:hypothetical protein
LGAKKNREEKNELLKNLIGKKQKTMTIVDLA